MPLNANEQQLLKLLTIDKIIGHYLNLTKRGPKLYWGICPFHSDHKPSLAVNPAKNTWKCYSCGEWGGVITFVVKRFNLSYTDAFKKIIADFSLPKQKFVFNLKPLAIRTEEQKKLYMINECAWNIWEYNIKYNRSQLAQQIINKRNLSNEIIQKFKIGLALKDFDIFINTLLKNNNFTRQELLKSKLVCVSEAKLKLFPFFLNRLIFPIFDDFGICGFSGRTIDSNLVKYLNSGETVIFQKNKTLYNFHNFASQINFVKEIFICEGFMDVIALDQCGIYNAVATMGTAISSAQINLLKTKTKTIVIFADNDEAGKKSAVINATRLISAKLPTKILFIDNQSIKDADEYLQKFGKAALKAFVQNKQIDVLKYLFEKYHDELSKTGDIDKFTANLNNFLFKVIAEDAIRMYYYEKIMQEPKNKYLKITKPTFTSSSTNKLVSERDLMPNLLNTNLEVNNQKHISEQEKVVIKNNLTVWESFKLLFIIFFFGSSVYQFSIESTLSMTDIQNFLLTKPSLIKYFTDDNKPIKILLKSIDIDNNGDLISEKKQVDEKNIHKFKELLQLIIKQKYHSTMEHFVEKYCSQDNNLNLVSINNIFEKTEKKEFVKRLSMDLKKSKISKNSSKNQKNI